MPQTPLVFLAFAQISSNHLAMLGQEMDAIHDALLPWQNERKLEIRPRMSANLDIISTMVKELRERVYIFHYGGHADDDTLHLADGANNAESVAELFRLMPNVKLVFLNGCATKAQVEAFWANGVNIVIATSIPVNDYRAKKLGAEFYSALSSKMNIGDAFLHAATTLKSKGEFPNTFTGKRNLFFEDDPDEASNDFAWDLYIKPGAEAALDWKLNDLPFLEEETDLDLPPEETPPLYHRLERLNYSKHVPLLRRYLLRHDIGAFLIHGPPRYGQTWLANNRLTAFKEMSDLDLPRAIQLGPRIANQAELIEEIKKVLRFGRGFESFATEIESISAKLLERLQNGPVLIRIHDVQDYLRNGFFDQFLDEFWQPLAQRIEGLKSKQEGQYHKLVLLLIEEQESLAEDHSRLLDVVPDIPDHSKILLLPDIPAIDLAEFNRWLEWDYNADESLFLNQFAALNEAQKEAWLGENGKMPPEAFMEKICDTFGYYFDVNGQGQWELVP
ncbi:MAG: CHAT domain-containing protein [Bacteroidia bacterium]